MELGEELPEPPPKRLPKSPPAGPNKLSKELEEAEDDEDEEDELPKEPKMLDKRPEPDGVAAVSVPVGVTPVVEVGEVEFPPKLFKRPERSPLLEELAPAEEDALELSPSRPSKFPRLPKPTDPKRPEIKPELEEPEEEPEEALDPPVRPDVNRPIRPGIVELPPPVEGVGEEEPEHLPSKASMAVLTMVEIVPMFKNF